MNRARLFMRGALSCLILLSACSLVTARDVSNRLLVQMPAEVAPSPIELVGVRVEGESVRPDEYFPAGDDWLRSLNFTLKNVSDRAILWSGVELIFRDGEGRQRVIYRIKYGNVPRRDSEAVAASGEGIVMPGESFEVAVKDLDWRELRRVLPKSGLDLSVHRVEFKLIKVATE